MRVQALTIVCPLTFFSKKMPTPCLRMPRSVNISAIAYGRVIIHGGMEPRYNTEHRVYGYNTEHRVYGSQVLRRTRLV